MAWQKELVSADLLWVSELDRVVDAPPPARQGTLAAA